MGTTTHLMTAEELFWLPDDGLRHELEEGKLIGDRIVPGFRLRVSEIFA